MLLPPLQPPAERGDTAASPEPPARPTPSRRRTAAGGGGGGGAASRTETARGALGAPASPEGLEAGKPSRRRARRRGGSRAACLPPAPRWGAPPPPAPGCRVPARAGYGWRGRYRPPAAGAAHLSGGGAERPPRGARPPRRVLLSPHDRGSGGRGKPLARPAVRTSRLPAAGPRRRLPVVVARVAAGSEQPPRRRRLHRGAVTMGRTPSPSGSHRREGGEGRGGERRHLERGARPGACRPPSWAWRDRRAVREKSSPEGLSPSPGSPWGGSLGPSPANGQGLCRGGARNVGFVKLSKERQPSTHSCKERSK